MPPSTAPVAVVIATRNRSTELLGTLTRLRALQEQPPIVVVDNGSTDGTSALVRDNYPGVQLVGLRRNRGAAARTVGARLVHSPYVAFSDDDSWWAPGALSRAVELPGWLAVRPGRRGLSAVRDAPRRAAARSWACEPGRRRPLPTDRAGT